MNYLQTLDTNLVDDMIGSKVIEIRKRNDYIKNELIGDMEEFYNTYGDIYEGFLFVIVNVIDGGFAKKYDTIYGDPSRYNYFSYTFVEYDDLWHIESDGLEKLDFSGMLITTEIGKYLMLSLDTGEKLHKFKPKYKDCYKLEWINGDKVDYLLDSEWFSASDSE